MNNVSREKSVQPIVNAYAALSNLYQQTPTLYMYSSKISLTKVEELTFKKSLIFSRHIDQLTSRF